VKNYVETLTHWVIFQVILQKRPCVALYRLSPCLSIYKFGSFLADKVLKLRPAQKIECDIKGLTESV